MADLPILFSAPMVRAVLREIERPGTGKTQTRRVLKNIEQLDGGDWHIFGNGGGIINVREENVPAAAVDYVPYAVDDHLYVREAWRTWAHYDDCPPRSLVAGTHLAYEATPDAPNLGDNGGKLRPGMFLPRWASRLTLIVTDVRVQRLNEISDEDAIAEGIVQHGRFYGLEDADWDDAVLDPREAFGGLWQNINGARGYGWYTNPWVAAYTFRPILGNIDQVLS